MSFTYTTLKQAIQDWTENDETTFVNNLDVFIKNTEESVLSEDQVKEQQPVYALLHFRQKKYSKQS